LYFELVRILSGRRTEFGNIQVVYSGLLPGRVTYNIHTLKQYNR